MKYVVYIMDDETSKPTSHFLSVEETSKEAENVMEKWWKAFENGEKAKPENYGGISMAPVSDFDQWKSPEEME